MEPLHKALKEELFTNDLLHADETTVEVLKEPGRESTAKSYIWLYYTSKANSHPVIIYDDQIGRSGEYVKNFLKDGSIQLSNNIAEQAIKMFVISRKNW